MKRTHLLALLVIGLGLPLQLHASSVKDCHFVGDITAVQDQKVSVIVRKAFFAGGHSMGRKCYSSPGQKLSVKLRTKPAWLKVGLRIVLLQRVVINMRPRPRRYISWSVVNRPVRIKVKTVTRVKTKEALRVTVRVVNPSDAVCQITGYSIGSSNVRKNVQLSKSVKLGARSSTLLTTTVPVKTKAAPAATAFYARLLATCSFRQ